MREAVISFLVLFSVVGCASTIHEPDVLRMTEVCRSAAGEAESPTVVQVLGGKRNEGFAGGQSLVASVDGGFVLGGITQGLGAYAGNADLLLVKIGGDGKVPSVWTFGGPQIDIGKALVPTSDGGSLQVGDSYGHLHTGMAYAVLGSKNRYLLLVKTDANGALQWHKLYLAYVGDEARLSDMHSVLQAADGGYVFSGSVGMNPKSPDGRKGYYGDCLLVKTDAIGGVEWARSYGGVGADEAFSSTTVTASGYVLAGAHEPGRGANVYEVLLLKTNVKGQLEWGKTFGGSGYNRASMVIQTADGGYAIAGDTYEFGAGQSDVLLIKVGNKGQLQWAQTYGSARHEHAHSLLQANDGGFVIVGSTSRTNANKADAVILTIDSDGNLIWAKTFGGAGEDQAFSVIETKPGAYAVLGDTESREEGNKDIFLLKYSTVRDSDDCLKAIVFEQSVPKLKQGEPKLNVNDIDFREVSESLRKQKAAPAE
jgi:hypothetical protein